MKTQTGIAQGGDFSDNTMTFEIEGEMILCAGKYAIVPIDDHETLVNNVVLNLVSLGLTNSKITHLADKIVDHLKGCGCEYIADYKGLIEQVLIIDGKSYDKSNSN